MKKKLSVAKIIQIVGMALLLAVIIAVNVVFATLDGMITVALGGYGVSFDNVDFGAGNSICEEITAEGVVLLKNDNNTLPLATSTEEGKQKKIAVFGWNATDGGFITSGAGSGGSADRGAGKLITFLEALEGKEMQPATDDRGNIQYNDDGTVKELMPAVEPRFEYYKPLIEMYKSYKSGRDSGDYWNRAYPFFNLIEPSYNRVAEYMAGAVEFADNGDTALVVISREGGEGQDMPRIQTKVNPDSERVGTMDNNNSGAIEDRTRTYLQISKEEEDMLKAVRANFDKVIVIVNACNAMDLGFIDEYADAALSVGGTGQSGTVAVAKILAGEITPSGRTADTYAYDHSTAATYANAPDCRTANGATGGTRTYSDASNKYYIDYAEGIYVGYKWYETADTMGFWESEFAKDKWNVNGYDDVVQYPFGYGLSYTDFDRNILQIESSTGTNVNENSEITVQVEVVNTGNMAGQDVVEIYYTPPYDSTNPDAIEKSSVNLIAFAKTEVLQPAGSKDEDGKATDRQLLEIKFKASDMKSYDYKGAVVSGGGYVLESGNYVISVRTDAHTVCAADGATATFRVAQNIRIDENVTNHFTGDDATDMGISIDGTNTDANITYLKRSDMEHTFPEPRGQRARHEKIRNLADNWRSTHRDTDDMPEQGVDNGYKLYELDKDGNVAVEDDGKPVYVDEELIMTLGKDYDADEWDGLLSQITSSELFTVVQSGGYQTIKIDSIGKPNCLDLDGPSGLNQENMTLGISSLWTSYPVETLMAQTWNAPLSYIYGLAVGNEALQTGVSGWYAPAVNIHRSPFDGRNFEYFSEDPYLSGVMGAETTRGALNNGLYCYVKHFAVNETENQRAGLYTWLTEQSLREIYLRPFEICVKDGNANAIMSSFNRLGATWAGGSYALITQVLREEWGFRGSVVTDYSTGGTYMSPDQGVRAGNDLWLNGNRTTSVGDYNDKTSATAIACAREATKNVLYTYCNTLYLHSQYDPEADTFGKVTPTPPAYWHWYAWLPIDLVLILGLLTWIYFCFFHGMVRNAVKKKKSAKNAENANTSESAENADTSDDEK